MHNKVINMLSFKLKLMKHRKETTKIELGNKKT